MHMNLKSGSLLMPSLPYVNPSLPSKMFTLGTFDKKTNTLWIRKNTDIYVTYPEIR